MDAKTIVKALFQQLTKGCNRYKCDNKQCATCKEFIHSFSSNNEVAVKAIELAKQYPENFCTGLPPEYGHPEYFDISFKFSEIMNKLILNKDLEEHKREITDLMNKVFSSVEQFEYLFVLNRNPLTRDNDGIDHELVSNVAELLYIHSEFFSQFAPQFSEFFKKLLAITDYSIHYLRAFLVLPAFRYYFDDENGLVSRQYFDLISKIRKDFPKEMSKDFYAKLKKYSSIAFGYLQMCQNNLTLAVLTNDGPNISINELPVVSITLDFILALRDANNVENGHFLTREYYNDPYSERVINEIKETHVFRLQVVQQARAAINIETKSQILRAILNMNQENIARSRLINAFMHNHGQFDERDLQLVIKVRRTNIVEDALHEFSRVGEDQLQRRMTVKFDNEPGVDAGGVSREFFYLITAELFNPDHGMFSLIDNHFYWFNVNSIESGYLFNLLGTIIGLAIYNGVILPIKFPIVLYKKLQGQPTTFEDLAELMPQVYESLTQIRQSIKDGESVEDLCLTFSVSYNQFDSVITEDLIAGGRDIPVTNENFEQYLDKLVNWYLDTSIRKSFDNFKRGFDKLCNRPEFTMFTPDELQVLVSGEDVFDWDALKLGTTYIDGYKENSVSVKMFWEIFDELPEEKKIAFLLFSTGTDKAPVGGLGQTHLVIQRTGDDTKLPVSHTCFNIFALPDYKNREKMRKNILIALNYTEGFGLK